MCRERREALKVETVGKRYAALAGRLDNTQEELEDAEQQLRRANARLAARKLSQDDPSPLSSSSSSFKYGVEMAAFGLGVGAVAGIGLAAVWSFSNRRSSYMSPGAPDPIPI